MFCKNCGSQVPDGMAFCAACGTPVPAAAPAEAPAAAPAANPIESVKKMAGDKQGLIKLIAILAAVAIVIGLAVGLLAGGGAKKVAKKYVAAQLESDMKAQFSLEAGKMRDLYEKECEDDDDRFEAMEERCDEEDIDVKIKNYNQYYKAAKKLNEASMKEKYGKKYDVEIEVREVIDMKEKVVDAYRTLLENDACEDYIDADKIKKGKFVVVKVIVDGSESTDTEDVIVPVFKYKGSWKVINLSYVYLLKDYNKEIKDAKEVSEAYQVISAATAKARGEKVQSESDY